MSVVDITEFTGVIVVNALITQMIMIISFVTVILLTIIQVTKLAQVVPLDVIIANMMHNYLDHVVIVVKAIML